MTGPAAVTRLKGAVSDTERAVAATEVAWLQGTEETHLPRAEVSPKKVSVMTIQELTEILTAETEAAEEKLGQAA